MGRALSFSPSPALPTIERGLCGGASHCFIRVVSDQSTVLKKSVYRLNTTLKLMVVQKRNPRVTIFLIFFPSLRLRSARSILKSD